MKYSSPFNRVEGPASSTDAIVDGDQTFHVLVGRVECFVLLQAFLDRGDLVIYNAFDLGGQMFTQKPPALFERLDLVFDFGLADRFRRSTGGESLTGCDQCQPFLAAGTPCWSCRWPGCHSRRSGRQLQAGACRRGAGGMMMPAVPNRILSRTDCWLPW